MPGWKDIIEEQEMWYVVRYLRHLPPKGSLGMPPVFNKGGKGESKEHIKIESPQNKRN